MTITNVTIIIIIIIIINTIIIYCYLLNLFYLLLTKLQGCFHMTPNGYHLMGYQSISTVVSAGELRILLEKFHLIIRNKIFNNFIQRLLSKSFLTKDVYIF